MERPGDFGDAGGGGVDLVLLLFERVERRLLGAICETRKEREMLSALSRVILRNYLLKIPTSTLLLVSAVSSALAMLCSELFPLCPSVMECLQLRVCIVISLDVRDIAR